MIAVIQRLIDREANLPLPASRLTPSVDLFALGMTSYGAVLLLVAIEHEFEIEFPHGALRRETVRSIGAIVQALEAARTPHSPLRV